VKKEFLGSALRVVVSLALFEVAWPSVAHAAGKIVYVDAATGNDANDCLAQTRACKTIQRGATLVRGGDQMLVGPGTYYEFPVFQNLGSDADVYGDHTAHAAHADHRGGLHAADYRPLIVAYRNGSAVKLTSVAGST
jgi:hypothetical protein